MLTSGQEEDRRYDPLARLREGDWRARALPDGRCAACDGYGQDPDTYACCERCSGTGTAP